MCVSTKYGHLSVIVFLTPDTWHLAPGTWRPAPDSSLNDKSRSYSGFQTSYFVLQTSYFVLTCSQRVKAGSDCKNLQRRGSGFCLDTGFRQFSCRLPGKRKYRIIPSWVS